MDSCVEQDLSSLFDDLSIQSDSKLTTAASDTANARCKDGVITLQGDLLKQASDTDVIAILMEKYGESTLASEDQQGMNIGAFFGKEMKNELINRTTE